MLRLIFGFVIDWSILEYMDRVEGFPQVEGVYHDVTLASRFSHDKGVDLVQVVLFVGGLEVCERDSQVDKFVINLA
jgi:hypothetical protein